MKEFGIAQAMDTLLVVACEPIRDITAPLFAAIMAQKVGPPLFESIDLLGIDLTRARIMNAMDLLGSLSKKKMSKLEKAWAKRS